MARAEVVAYFRERMKARVFLWPWNSSGLLLPFKPDLHICGKLWPFSESNFVTSSFDIDLCRVDFFAIVILGVLSISLVDGFGFWLLNDD